jgi:HEAT repeat protein
MVWVPLPSLAPAGCVSLVVAEPHAAKEDTSLAEVTIFSELDVAGGMEQLIESVASEKSGAAGAEQVLSRRGVDAARAIAARLEKSQEGRRRLLGVLAELKVPEAAAPLGKALETARSDERAVVVTGLTKLGEPGAAEARRVYGDASQAAGARADAAQVLGAVGGEANAAALIQGAADARVERATLLALNDLVTREPKRADAIAAALDADATCGVQTGIFARVIPGRDAVDRAWSRCAAADIPVRLRLARAHKNTQRLAAAARDQEPMVRAAAVESGAAPLYSDPDPGVRRVSLLKSREAAPVENALQRDSWPMVRRAAAESLGRVCGPSTNALTTAVEKDPAEEVRREALVALARCGPVPTPLLARLLKSHEQPIGVRELAAVFLAKQGGPGVAVLLAEAVDDVLSDPAADERSASLAIACLRGLGKLKDGSRRVLEALGAASNEPLSGAVRAASMDAIGQICPEGAGDALKRGKDDPDPMVRRAAKQALDKCKR